MGQMRTFIGTAAYCSGANVNAQRATYCGRELRLFVAPERAFHYLTIVERRLVAAAKCLLDRIFAHERARAMSEKGVLIMVGNTIMVLHRTAALIGGLTVDGFVLDAKLQRRTLFIWHS